jgi:hypothetical protein
VVGDLIIDQVGATWTCTPVGTSTITACTNSSTTVTYTVSSTANLCVGQTVSINGITGFTTNNPNGTWTVNTIPSSTTFTVVVTSAPTGSYGSNGTAGVWRAPKGSGLPSHSSPTFVSTTALQLSANYWTDLFITDGTSTAIAYTVTMGQQLGTEYNVYETFTATKGNAYVPVPPGWLVVITCATIADLTFNAITS